MGTRYFSVITKCCLQPVNCSIEHDVLLHRHEIIIRVREIKKILPWQTSRRSHTWWTQTICITFAQRRPNVFDAGPTLYKCYTNVVLLGRPTRVSVHCNEVRPARWRYKFIMRSLWCIDAFHLWDAAGESSVPTPQRWPNAGPLTHHWAESVDPLLAARSTKGDTTILWYLSRGASYQYPQGGGGDLQ